MVANMDTLYVYTTMVADFLWLSHSTHQKSNQDRNSLYIWHFFLFHGILYKEKNNALTLVILLHYSRGSTPCGVPSSHDNRPQ